MVLDAATIDNALLSGSTNAVTNSAITSAILPLQNADIPSARPLGDGNYQLNINGDTNSWQPITTSTLNLNDLGDVVAPAPGDDNVLQYNSTAGRWVNAVLPAAQTWDAGYTASMDANVVALRGATDPVFTDTTYNLDVTRNSTTQAAEVRLRDGNTNADVVSTVTISGGTNISLGVAGQSITINAPNFSDVEVYTTTALRNAATDIEWHRGDLAIAGGSTWIYIGTDQTAAGITVDADWEELVTPSTQLDAMGVLNQLNMNDGSTGGINDSLISSNIQRASSAVTTSSSITALSDVSYNAPALANPLPNTFLIWDDTNNRWTNSSNTISDFLSVTVRNLEDRLSEITDETIPLTKVNNAIALDDLVVGPDATASGSGDLAYDNTSGVFTYTPPVIPTVSGLPSAPDNGMNAARYELNVPATGSDPSAPTWVAVEADTGSDAPVTVSDAEPDSPEVGDLRYYTCLLYTSPSPRDRQKSRMPSSA